MRPGAEPQIADPPVDAAIDIEAARSWKPARMLEQVVGVNHDAAAPTETMTEHDRIHLDTAQHDRRRHRQSETFVDGERQECSMLPNPTYLGTVHQQRGEPWQGGRHGLRSRQEQRRGDTLDLVKGQPKGAKSLDEGIRRRTGVVGGSHIGNEPFEHRLSLRDLLLAQSPGRQPQDGDQLFTELPHLQ